MTLPAVLSLIAAVLGTAVLLGGVIAVLFTQFKRNTSAILREQNADQSNRITTLEADRAKCKEELAAMKAALEVVTGAAAVAELRKAVAAMHAEVVRRLDNLWDRRTQDIPVEHDRRRPTP